MSGSYVYQIVTPPNTTEENPLQTHTILSLGLLVEIKLGFPPGCANLLRVRIKENDRVIIPNTPDSYIAWDNFVWTIPLEMKITDNQDDISICTWNIDNTYSHQLSVSFEILPQMQSTRSKVDNVTEALFGVRLLEG